MFWCEQTDFTRFLSLHLFLMGISNEKEHSNKSLISLVQPLAKEKQLQLIKIVSSRTILIVTVIDCI